MQSLHTVCNLSKACQNQNQIQYEQLTKFLEVQPYISDKVHLPRLTASSYVNGKCFDSFAPIMEIYYSTAYAVCQGILSSLLMHYAISSI